ncbi:ferredoxin [Methanofollis tationis]|uniref:Ferredoxin n=2 Tax=Methanofollis tationis TaxID=81417 RepID=A0A7K4HNQ7_9EURY|nr:ferredoxin [Methanofollis tationis]
MGSDLGNGIVPNDDLACVQETAAACPVEIISVEE